MPFESIHESYINSHRPSLVSSLLPSSHPSLRPSLPASLLPSLPAALPPYLPPALGWLRLGASFSLSSRQCGSRRDGMRRPALAPPPFRDLACNYSQWESHSIVSGMRCATDKASRVALTLLLVLFMVYLVRNGSEDPAAKTLQLNLAEEKPAVQDNNDDLESPDTTARPSRPTPMAGLRPYTVIKNKVYYLDVTPPPTANGEAMLEHSEAKALKHLNYSKYNPEERQYLQGHVDVMVERAKQVKHACVNPPPSRHRIPNFVWDTNHNVIWCPNYKDQLLPVQFWPVTIFCFSLPLGTSY
ncbi:uncharacterized protein LOC135090210 [Scylla paramamosain]|uniref:uncharacterized protein LOC135090210 n=1 Tax=Scylla paramamosain TaxID=85552 RepID=UPI003083E6FE